jgi:hypothetical protein
MKSGYCKKRNLLRKTKRFYRLSEILDLEGMRYPRNLNAFPALLAVVLLSLTLLVPSPVILADEGSTLVKEGNPILLLDDFSQSPVNWRFLNASRWDPERQYMVLTQPGSERVGVTWLKTENITSPFTAEFRYTVGGGSGADGFVFMFYKDSDYEPGIGGYLGFQCRPVTKPCPEVEAPGYGLEFDSYFNSEEAYNMGDPSSHHIAILKDSINTHVVYVNDSRVSDNRWHQVKLVVGTSDIVAYVDSAETLRWSEPMVNHTFSGMGFGSGIWGYDDWHIINDFKLYGNTVTIRGLQPSWSVELAESDGTVLDGEPMEAPSDGGSEIQIDTTGLSMPLTGRFRILEGNQTMFETPSLDDIWGGDVYALQPETNTSTSTTITPTTSIPSSLGGLDQVIIAVAILLTAFAVMLILLRTRRRTDSDSANL